MTEPYDQIVAQLETVRTGPELSRLVASVRPSLDVVTASIGQAQAVLAAAQELLTLDVSDLPKVVTFLGKLKTEVLGPYLAAYAKTLSAQAGNAAGIAQVTAAIAAAASRIGVPIP